MIFTPKTIDLFTTQDCNCRCTYCYVEKQPARLDAETARAAVDWLLRMAPTPRPKICFFGGEPLLEFGTMQEVVEYGDEAAAKVGKKLSYSMTTNGAIWSDEIDAWIEAHRVGVNLSFDGLPAAQDRNRALVGGGPTYPLVARTLQARLARHPSQGVRMTFDAANVGDLAANVRHIWSLGCRSVHPAAAVNSPWTDDSLRDYERQLRSLAVEILARGPNDYYRCGSVAKPVKKWRDAEQKRTAGRNASRLRARYACGAGHSYLAVACDGDIYPCHRFVGMGAQRLGDIYGDETGSAKSWAEYDSNQLFPGCYGCPSREVCAGGCPAVTYQANGSLVTPSLTQCAITRIETRVARWVLAKCDDPEMLDTLTGAKKARKESAMQAP